MINKNEYILSITRNLNLLDEYVNKVNSIRLFDVNILAETFFRDLLNLIFQLNLVNINDDEPNAPYIDLIDNDTKNIIQITSNNKKTKIVDTVTWADIKYWEKWFKLQIIIFGKSAVKNQNIANSRLNFKSDDNVLDTKKILGILSTKSAEQLKPIYEFLKKEITSEKEDIECIELSTILELVQFISNEKPIINDSTTISPEQVDPQKKIYEIFKDYATILKRQYAELFPIYSSLLNEVRGLHYSDIWKVAWIRIYLNDCSRQDLRSSWNDPEIALNKMIDFFEAKLKRGDFLPNRWAIKFYLLDELIECNVFPLW